MVYTYDKKPPRLRLRYRRQVDGHNGELTIFASRPGGIATFATARQGSPPSPLLARDRQIPGIF